MEAREKKKDEEKRNAQLFFFRSRALPLLSTSFRHSDHLPLPFFFLSFSGSFSVLFDCCKSLVLGVGDSSFFSLSGRKKTHFFSSHQTDQTDHLVLSFFFLFFFFSFFFSFARVTPTRAVPARHFISTSSPEERGDLSFASRGRKSARERDRRVLRPNLFLRVFDEKGRTTRTALSRFFRSFLFFSMMRN